MALQKFNLNNTPEYSCEYWTEGLLKKYQKALKEDKLGICNIPPVMEGHLSGETEWHTYKWSDGTLMELIAKYTKTLSGKKRKDNEMLIANIQKIMLLLANNNENQLSEEDKMILFANCNIVNITNINDPVVKAREDKWLND